MEPPTSSAHPRPIDEKGFAAAARRLLTEGTARAWLAAIVRCVAVPYAVIHAAAVVNGIIFNINRALQESSFQSADRSAAQEFSTKLWNAWDAFGVNLLWLVLWSIAAWKAARFASFVFPVHSRCCRCGYILSKLAKGREGGQTVACPECGEKQPVL